MLLKFHQKSNYFVDAAGGAHDATHPPSRMGKGILPHSYLPRPSPIRRLVLNLSAFGAPRTATHTLPL